MAGGLTPTGKLAWARLALCVERAWPLLLPVAASVNGIVGFGLYDGPHALPPWLHGLGLVAAYGTLGWGLRRWWQRIDWPDQAATMRRLEIQSGLRHQPLSVQQDHPVGGNDALWQAHCQRMQQHIPKLRLVWPRWNLIASDPWGWRFWVWVPLILGLVVGHDDLGHRLGAAWAPQWGPGPQVQAWVTPPTVTGLAPFMLTEGAVIPAGSVLRVSVGLDWGRAVLHVDGQAMPLQGDGDQHLETNVTQAHHIQLERWWLNLGYWNVQTVLDQPPKVAFSQPLDPSAAGGRVMVKVRADDDYGISRVWLHIQSELGDEEQVELASPTSLIPHWQGESRPGPELGLAGLGVTILPMATDSAGQTTAGDGMVLVWPERHYSDPAARTLNQMRHVLLQQPDLAAQMGTKLAALIPSLDHITDALALQLARRDLEQNPPNIREAQRLLLGAANRRQDMALAQLHLAVLDLQHRLDTMPSGKDKDQLAQMFATLLSQMMGTDGNGEDGLFSPGEQSALLNSLDRLAAGAGAGSLLDQLAQALAARLGKGNDPFGHGAVDDQSTSVPGADQQADLGRILRDIRQRVLDGSRPANERHYLKRLME